MPYTRDPLSVRFDPAARSFLTDAYAAGTGTWVTRFLPPPGPRALAWMRAQGAEPYERDRWGELRWIRAYKRAVYWQAKWYGGTSGLRASRNTASGGRRSRWGAPVRVEWQTGVRAPAGHAHAGDWAVRIRLHPAGYTTRMIGQENAIRRGDAWIIAGQPTYLQSNPEFGDRPWE